MSTLENVRSTLPLMPQRRVKKLKASLKQRGLLVVMDEVLAHATFNFDHSSLAGRKTLRVFLGDRNQYDGTTVAVWAYISDDPTGSKPPIVFRDEVPVRSNGVTATRLYPRSASSLLRNARQLRLPISFLQQELDEGVENGRGMLCAVIAYYALITGSSDCAIRWPRFDACLIAALNYINNVYGLPRAKHEMQQKTTSEITTSKASMASYDAASKLKNLIATTDMDMAPELEGGARQPAKFADKDHRHNKSLVVRLELDGKALAEITEVAQLSEVPGSQDEGMRFGANECDNDLDDDVDSVIGDDMDSVIGDAIDDDI